MSELKTKYPSARNTIFNRKPHPVPFPCKCEQVGLPVSYVESDRGLRLSILKDTDKNRNERVPEEKEHHLAEPGSAGFFPLLFFL